jgi:hypothetical protein
MMQEIAFGHALETLHEGLTVFLEGRGTSMSMKSTNIDVDIKAGIAVTRITRIFKNDEDVSIEAILTMPVAFDAVVTGLEAMIDGRRLLAASKAKEEARETYESAVDSGKMAILHEEALRGVHVLSIGQLGAGKEVSIVIETVAPLMQLTGSCFLRIPTTVGAVYGSSPFLPADDLMTSARVKLVATLRIKADAGQISLSDGSTPRANEPIEVTLDKSIEISLSKASFGKTVAMSATGHPITMSVQPIKSSDNHLNMAILVDRSGSMGLALPHSAVSKWDAVREGLAYALKDLNPSDQIGMWQFDNECQFLGQESGGSSASLSGLVEEPAGGTKLGKAVHRVVASGAKDVLIVTDGQTCSNTVDELRSKNARLSAILVGSDSLDANIGYLCANSGGQVYYASNDDVASILNEALKNLRRTDAAIKGKAGDRYPASLKTIRGSAEIVVTWSIEKDKVGKLSDPIGRYAASLALPLLEPTMAQDFAALHCLSTHNTSLVLVDEEGEVPDSLPEMRKVPLMHSPSEFSPRLNRLYPYSEPNLSMSQPSDSLESEPASASLEYLQQPVNKMLRQAKMSPPNGTTFMIGTKLSGGSFLSRLFGGFLDKSKNKMTKLPNTISKTTSMDASARYELAKRIEWDALVNDLLDGDLTKLSFTDQALVEQYSDQPDVKARAIELSIPAPQLALLKLALLVEGENISAERFARRILDGKDPELGLELN